MKLMIVGAGFCGALVAKKLDSAKDFDITLIDKKGYFEYTPANHKVALNKEYHRKIIVPLNYYLKNSKIVVDEIKKISPESVETSKEKYPFDFLVIAAGIDYPIFLENKKNVFILKTGNEH